MTTTRLLVAAFLLVAGPAWGADDGPAGLYESEATPSRSNPIDRVVLPRLEAEGSRPVLCSDAVFLRRAYLDLIGVLPTAAEARAFLDDPDTAHKRSALVDRLLSRDEFSDYWAMRWGDVLRIKAEFPVNLWPNAAQAYHRWVRASIAENKPYDQFVRELLTSSGSNFRVGPVNFYRAVQNRTPEGIAGAVALTFLGCRTDAWPADRVKGLAVFFSQVGYKPTREWKEESVFWDPLHSSVPAANVAPEKPETGAKPAPPADPPPPPRPTPLVATFPDGSEVTVPVDRDPREVFADWLVTSKNPWLSRAIVNRVWYWMLGRGIVHEPDDIRDDNPPSVPELLKVLQASFERDRYDLKALYRLIANSSTYQLSSVPHDQDPRAAASFARYPLRRLDAEVLIDAINRITGTTDLYTSPIPEPFTYIPEDAPAVSIADGSITSPFLTLFGRSARATGMENERNNKPVPAQWLHLLNSSHIQRKLETSTTLRTIFDPSRKPDQVVDDLYLTILSRFPTPEERKAVSNYMKSTRARRDVAIDLPWALFNSPEFLYRH